MKKNFALLFLLISSYASTHGQTAVKDTSWKVGGFASLIFNQVYFSNWAAGGENSFSITALGSGYANYKLGKNYWNNYLNLSYGAINSQYLDKIRKNVDMINLGSKAGHELGSKFYLAALVDFTSQFANGYNYPNDTTIVSKLLAPGYLVVSAGIDWKPVDYFSLYVSPATGKFTFVTDQLIADAGIYGNEPAVYDTSGLVLVSRGKTVRSEFGAYLTAQFQKDVVKNVNVLAKLGLFENYTDKVKSNRKNVDVTFNLLIAMKINNWLGASFFTNILYDNDIFIFDRDSKGNVLTTGGPRTQVNEGFGLSLSYKFGNEAKK